MSIVTLAQESPRQGGFYVPSYEVKLEGVGLPRDVLRDILEVSYKDNIQEIDSFELRINNWDAAAQAFKYVGAETPESLRGDTPDSRRFRMFEPCAKDVSLAMGYAGDLRVMLTGNFTTMEPSFPSGGGPTLTVRGLNVLHQLRRRPYTTVWERRRDSDIAENIATLRDRGHNRFPLPIETDPTAKGEEPVLDYVAQRNMHDIDFLLYRARQRGYVVVVREADPAVRGSRRRLYFGPSHGGAEAAVRDVTYELHWGRSLMEFKPTLTTANQVKSVTVQGWDRRRRAEIRETVSIDDRRITRNRDLHDLLTRCNPREDVVVDEPVFGRAQARARALALLMDRQKEMVKASASTVGLADLRAGRRVRIQGVGARFSGVYFVTESNHTIGSGGYVTRFQARREDDGRGAR